MGRPNVAPIWVRNADRVSALRRKQRLPPRGAGAATWWPYRLTPRFQGPFKLGQGRPHYQCAFSIASAPVIASPPLPLYFRTGGGAAVPAPTSGSRALGHASPATSLEARGLLSASDRQQAREKAYGTSGWLGRKLELSYKPYRISSEGNILDLAFGGFLESAPFPDPDVRNDQKPAAEPGESEL